MAGTVIVPQVFAGREAAAAPGFVAGAAQMELPNNAPTLLHIKASGAVTMTITNQTQTPDGAANPNRAVGPLAAGNERIMRINSATYNMSNGNVQLAFDTPANVQVTAYQLA